MKHINRLGDWLYKQPSTDDDRLTWGRCGWAVVAAALFFGFQHLMSGSGFS